MDYKDLTKLYSYIDAIRNAEIREKGNEIVGAWITFNRLENMPIKQHVNVLKIIRTYGIYDFMLYFIKFKENIALKQTETKLDLDDYDNEVIKISQILTIKMEFKITTKKIIRENSKILIKFRNNQKLIYNYIKNSK